MVSMALMKAESEVEEYSFEFFLRLFSSSSSYIMSNVFPYIYIITFVSQLQAKPLQKNNEYPTGDRFRTLQLWIIFSEIHANFFWPADADIGCRRNVGRLPYSPFCFPPPSRMTESPLKPANTKFLATINISITVQ